MKNTFQEDLKLGNEYQQKFIELKGWKNYEVKKGYFKPYDVIDDEGIKWEVKTDRYTQRTNNICIEFKCSGNLSGISTTESKYYAYIVLRDGKFDLYEIPTRKIKKYIRKEKYHRIISGGYEKRARLYLFDIGVFEKYLKN
jgi:hypothetical protein